MRHYLPTEPEIHILGRTRKGTPLPLFWTASGLEFQTDAGELWFELESGYDVMEEWIRIEVDGFCLQRMMVPKGKSRLCAFRGFPAGSLRTVRLLKEVQPMRDDEGRFLLVHGLDCDGNLFPVPKKRCRIEFVGDSLSAGVGLGGAPSLIGPGLRSTAWTAIMPSLRRSIFRRISASWPSAAGERTAPAITILSRSCRPIMNRSAAF